MLHRYRNHSGPRMLPRSRLPELRTRPWHVCDDRVSQAREMTGCVSGQPRDGVTTRLTTGGRRHSRRQRIWQRWRQEARAHAPGASPHMRLLPQGWVVVMRRSSVYRVQSDMSVSEPGDKVVEGRTSRARAPFRMLRNCAQHTAMSAAHGVGPTNPSNLWDGQMRLQRVCSCRTHRCCVGLPCA